MKRVFESLGAPQRTRSAYTRSLDAGDSITKMSSQEEKNLEDLYFEGLAAAWLKWAKMPEGKAKDRQRVELLEECGGLEDLQWNKLHALIAKLEKSAKEESNS